MIDDHFRIIEGYPGYRVNREGEVQSRWGRGVRRVFTETWRPLKLVPCRGYQTVNLSDGVTKRRRYVHRLVLQTFVGPCPEGMVCCHDDGDRANNRLENLRWDTYRANEHDKLRHGTWLFGERINAKLTEAAVREIRRLRSEGVTLAALAEAFAVTGPNVHAIVSRRSWRHLP